MDESNAARDQSDSRGVVPYRTDVLGALLEEKYEDENTKLIQLQSIISNMAPKADKSRREAVGTERRDRTEKSKAKGTKRKSTYYLGREMFQRLDRAKQDLKEYMPADFSWRVTKTGIVAVSLRLILQDFENRGGESLLARMYTKRLKAEKGE